MNPQFKKGVIELCVLGLFDDRDMYGYEVVKEIAKYIDTNENTIYPILRRLTKDGLLKSYTVDTESGPVRKYFSLTPMGKEKFEVLVEEWDSFTGNVSTLLKRRKNND